jgi:hypothetical protein
VKAVLTCPSCSETTFGDTPAASAIVAAECRKSYSLIRGKPAWSSIDRKYLARCRIERLERGEAPDGPDIRGVFIFIGGLFPDGHTHPWYTTPMLRRLPNRAGRREGRPFALFKRTPGVRKMWSKGYQVTDAELGELHSAMDRTMVCSSSQLQQAMSRITKPRATGSIPAACLTLIAISSRSWWAAAMKILLNTGRSTSRRSD